MVCDMRNRFWICLIFTVPIFFYSPMGLFTPPQPPFGLKHNLWLFIFATLAIVYPSWPFFVSAWRALRTGALSMAASVACRPAPIYRGLSQRERVYLRTVSLTGKLTHPWDEPAETVLRLAPEAGVSLVMPRLGEPVEPSRGPIVDLWWRAVAPQGAVEPAKPPDGEASLEWLPD